MKGRLKSAGLKRFSQEHLTGRNATSPRTHIPLGSCTDADSGEDAFCQTKGRQQTTVNAVVSYVGAAGGSRKLWKLLVGLHPLAGWTGPKYPNVTAGNEPTLQCGMPPTGGCLYDLEADPTEHAPLEGPSSRDSASGPLQRALLTSQMNSGSLYRCDKSA